MRPLRVDRSQLLWHRLRANHLADRLASGSFAAAAFAGLQDSAPRAALVSLYSRVKAVEDGDWEDPSLVQTWAPRGAVFVVPRSDLGVFARGIVPRDLDVRRALDELGARARRSVKEPRPKGKEAGALGTISPVVAAGVAHGPLARLVFAMEGIQVRWDARTTVVLPSPEPEIDDEDARRELLRRFLHSLGPAGPLQFARWAAIGVEDAKATFDVIEDELVPVDWPGGAGWLLAADGEQLSAATAVSGYRFVAFGGDPVLQPGEDIVVPDRSFQRAALPRWASLGLVLRDGRAVASWGRKAGRCTLFPFRPLHSEAEAAIEGEASQMPLRGSSMQVLWRRDLQHV
ncbi:MAG: crosslink repair DNA glycosylase YcaQ family protein [Acidimicrobiales bacterium]|jgi:hypothetical protein|nr:crosslink repair DNA glycosylase YcaQ family protein [Acidimicrobiales bacterium]